MHWNSPRNTGCRIRSSTVNQSQMVTLENAHLRLTINCTRGSDIVELLYKPRDLDFAWLRQNAFAATQTVQGYHDARGHFVDAYPGGWQEIFPNGGAASTVNSAPFGQHDEVFAREWAIEIVTDSPDLVAISLSVMCQKIPVRIHKVVSLERDAGSFTIRESATNISPTPVRAMWGQHIAYGAPFLEPGCTIHLEGHPRVLPHAGSISNGAKRTANDQPFAWSTAAGPDGSAIDLSVVPDLGTPSDIVYLSNVDRYAIWNPRLELGARVQWRAETMPYLWFWQEFGDNTAYPWYGDMFTIGLEPFSSYPTNGLPEAIANDSALTLQPQLPIENWLTWEAITDIAEQTSA